MLKLIRVPILCGMILASILADESAVEAAPKADAKKAGRPDATKLAPAAGLLPADCKLTAEQLARHIDKLIEQKVATEKVGLSPTTDDAEFLRRVYLDLTGKIPSADKTVAFLDSKEANKRATLIDQLLESKDYGKHMADVWQALLLTRSVDTRRFLQYYPNVEKWLEEQFNSNAGWDKITRGILTASGPVDKTGPVAYYLANATADKMTDNATRMFLGVQLQCAQCHNHPFTEWKQNEYWQMAAFFTKVRPRGQSQGGRQDRRLDHHQREARPPQEEKRRLAGVGEDPAPEVPRRRAARREGQPAGSAHPGRLGDQPEEPLLRPGDGQPDVGPVVRPGFHQPRGRHARRQRQLAP